MPKVIVLGTAHPHIFGMVANARLVPNAEIVGVWDDDAARLAKAAEALKTPAFDSLDKALATKPDVALVAAVPGDRASVAIRALEAGVPSLVDKPLAVTHASLDKLIAAQQRAKLGVIAYYPYRGTPHILAAKAALDAGRIGKIVRVFSAGPHQLNTMVRPDWHFSRAGNGGILVDTASHHIDIACFFTGQSPNWVCGRHGNFSKPDKPEFQDFGHAILNFPGGAMAHVEVDWLNPSSMKYFGDTRTWIQGTAGKIEVRIGDVVSAEIWTDKLNQQPLDLSAFQPEEKWCAKLILDLANRAPTIITQDEVWKTSRATLHAFDSAAAGGVPVKIK